MSFRREIADWLHTWRPDPDDDAAHASVLLWLTGIVAGFLPAPVTLANWLKGNIGESVAHYVGDGVKDHGCRVFCANALDPFSGISKTEIDIVWLILGASPSADVAILQEVKTTSEQAMSVVAGLTDDYEKLFGTDIKRTMLSRLHAIANEIEYTGGDKASADRVRALALAKSPELATQMRLRPTVVHAGHLDPQARLQTVRDQLLNLGWNGAAVDAWMIALADLDARFTRLAEGN